MDQDVTVDQEQDVTVDTETVETDIGAVKEKINDAENCIGDTEGNVSEDIERLLNN